MIIVKAQQLRQLKEEFQKEEHGEHVGHAQSTMVNSHGETILLSVRVASKTKTKRHYYRCVRYFLLGDDERAKWHASIDNDFATPDEAIKWIGDASLDT